MPNIMRAKKKELRAESLESFQVEPKLKVSGAEVQVKTRLHKILDGKDASVRGCGAGGFAAGRSAGDRMILHRRGTCERKSE